MPLDPVLQGLLSALESAPALSAGTAQQAREAFAGMIALLESAFPDGPRVPVDDVTEITVAGGDGPLRARRYRHGPEGPAPTVVFLHGGGFSIGSLDTHDDLARLLARAVRGVVVSVDYRLAPEHPHPAAADDAGAATRDVLARLDRHGADPQRVGIAGDSAGGNLAAVIAQELRDRPGAAPLAAQLLLYPATDLTDDLTRYPSRLQNAEGYFLTAADMIWFAEQYLPAGCDRTDPRLSPLLAPDLTNLPPAVVATAEFDPLRDEGVAYALALEAAGVPVKQRCYDGLIHGFAGMAALSPACAAATDEALGAFAEMLG